MESADSQAETAVSRPVRVDLGGGPDKIEDGCTPQQPNEPTYRVAAIEFTDGGRFEDPSQLRAVDRCIRRARRSNPNGAVVLAFVHGWHRLRGDPALARPARRATC